MPNISGGKSKDNSNSKSGHGALGMGGQPTDDPRDLKGGHESITNDDRTRQVGGASGSAAGDQAGGGSSNQVVGVGGDKAMEP